MARACRLLMNAPTKIVINAEGKRYEVATKIIRALGVM